MELPIWRREEMNSMKRIMRERHFNFTSFILYVISLKPLDKQICFLKILQTQFQILLINEHYYAYLLYLPNPKFAGFLREDFVEINVPNCVLCSVIQSNVSYVLQKSRYRKYLLIFLRKWTVSVLLRFVTLFVLP